jgi:putative SOS response-associated peptidase YedK
MTWGFPVRLQNMKPGSKPKAVNNAADLSKPMWKGLAERPQGRCLIPMTEFAEAEGIKGAMTRTWFSVKGQPIFAWGGLWRQSGEWGPVYSGVMTGCNEAIRPVHDRMPVLVMPDEWERWLRGSYEDVMAFQARCFPDDLTQMLRTTDPWLKRSKPLMPNAGPCFGTFHHRSLRMP